MERGCGLSGCTSKYLAMARAYARHPRGGAARPDGPRAQLVHRQFCLIASFPTQTIPSRSAGGNLVRRTRIGSEARMQSMAGKTVLITGGTDSLPRHGLPPSLAPDARSPD